jgi:hypothetical protein
MSKLKSTVEEVGGNRDNSLRALLNYLCLALGVVAVVIILAYLSGSNWAKSQYDSAKLPSLETLWSYGQQIYNTIEIKAVQLIDQILGTLDKLLA